MSSTAQEASAAIEAAEASNEPKVGAKDKLEELCVNTIRFLAVDAVEKAKSGHPGSPMGMADMAFVLWTEFLRHDPKAPKWQDRDRFVLSAGHASMLLYSLLHLTGYPDMTMDQLKSFRQWGSKTAGHPEYGHAVGIEVTTGPLGQGFGNAVGMGIASKMMAARFDTDDPFKPVSNTIYCICSDGDLMEGISSEAASLAGHLGLGNLIYLYDDNYISLDGETRFSFSDDVKKRFEAVHWHVQSIDGHDRNAVRKAIKKAQKVTDRPSLIMARTIIGWGSPKFHGTSRAHGEPLGADEVKATKAAIGWPQEPTFLVPDEVRAEFDRKTKKLAREHKKWDKGMEEWRARNPQLAEEWDRYWNHTLLVEAGKADKATATRELSGQVIQKLAAIAPFLIGGAADLSTSTKTNIKETTNIVRAKESPDKPPALEVFKGRNLYFGVREHSMGAEVNGITLYGPWRAFGSTFLIFSDYMRPAIRLAALMDIPSIFVYTHDSVFLGEDGPTHQSVEQLFSLRLIPNMTLFRPADGAETGMAWAWAVGKSHGPNVLVFTRQKLDPIPRGEGFDPHEIWRGAYVLDRYRDGDITIIATGSEVPLAVKTADLLRGEGLPVRVVSAPSLDLFDRQDIDYQDRVLGNRSRVVAIEAGRSAGWYKYVNHDALVIGIDRFGASAPYEKIAEELGFTPAKVAEHIRAWRK
ncbi:MAG: transketolase [Acidobacteria bacterium]|nr:MAG: transketolase [Acidobacteriota bacterium]